MPPNYPPSRYQELRVTHRPGVDLDAVIAEKMAAAPFDTTAYAWDRRTATETLMGTRIVYEVIEGTLKEGA